MAKFEFPTNCANAESSFLRLVFVRCSCAKNLESFKKRLSALEKYIAETEMVLTEAQVQALKKKQEDDVAHGEIERLIPAISAATTHFTSAPSRAWGGCAEGAPQGKL